MSAKTWIAIGAICGAMGVAAGALGAHGLRAALLPEVPSTSTNAEALRVAERRIENFDVAVRYQMYHAPALVLMGLLMKHRRSRWLQAAGCLLLSGVLLFCGFLYAWALWQVTWFVHVVPFGGTAFILGWLAMAVGALRSAEMAP